MEDFGVVEQPQHTGVPILVGLEFSILFMFLQEARLRDDLQRIGRRWQNDSHQIVRVERDGAHQLLELLRRDS